MQISLPVFVRNGRHRMGFSPLAVILVRSVVQVMDRLFPANPAYQTQQTKPSKPSEPSMPSKPSEPNEGDDGSGSRPYTGMSSNAGF